jgi:hypothetical protein
MWVMLSTPRTTGRGRPRIRGGRRRLLALAGLLLAGLVGLIATQASANQGNGNACPPSSHSPGGAPPCGFPPESEPPPETPPPPPPEEPPPNKEPTAVVSEPPAPPPAARGGVASATAKGHSGGGSGSTGSQPTVTVKPAENPPAQHAAKPGKPSKQAPKVAAVPPPVLTTTAPTGPATNPERSTFAERLLTPGEIHLDAEHLGKGGLLAFLLAALLYLPITIFNKATEKNHEVFDRWLAHPRAWLAAIASLIPFQGHTLLTLVAGVLASTVLFSFVEPGFPRESGSLEYLIGMLLGFAIVSTVFFGTWRFVVDWLEPHSSGRWKIYPPFILLAACLVVLTRVAHLLPGVVIGTVAEYEPTKKLNRRTAGIRVANTYGALLLVGLIAWFAWIPVEHAASHEGASSLTLILDSALAIIFVSSLESAAFGLIPMKFLDGNDLFVWRKGLWAAMWGASLLWFSIVILNPALSTYSHLSTTKAIALAILFGGLMFGAVATWGYFRWRDAQLERAAKV